MGGNRQDEIKKFFLKKRDKNRKEERRRILKDTDVGNRCFYCRLRGTKDKKKQKEIESETM